MSTLLAQATAYRSAASGLYSLADMRSALKKLDAPDEVIAVLEHLEPKDPRRGRAFDFIRKRMLAGEAPTQQEMEAVLEQLADRGRQAEFGPEETAVIQANPSIGGWLARSLRAAKAGDAKLHQALLASAPAIAAWAEDKDLSSFSPYAVLSELGGDPEPRYPIHRFIIEGISEPARTWALRRFPRLIEHVPGGLEDPHGIRELVQRVERWEKDSREPLASLTVDEADEESRKWAHARIRAGKNEPVPPPSPGAQHGRVVYGPSGWSDPDLEGFVIAELDLEDLAEETRRMTHCVGNDPTYRNALEDGTGRIFSVRDPTDTGVATIFTDTSGRTIRSCLGVRNATITDRAQKAVDEWKATREEGAKKGPDWESEHWTALPRTIREPRENTERRRQFRQEVDLAAQWIENHPDATQALLRGPSQAGRIAAIRAATPQELDRALPTMSEEGRSEVARAAPPLWPRLVSDRSSRVRKAVEKGVAAMKPYPWKFVRKVLAKHPDPGHFLSETRGDDFLASATWDETKEVIEAIADSPAQGSREWRGLLPKFINPDLWEEARADGHLELARGAIERLAPETAAETDWSQEDNQALRHAGVKRHAKIAAPGDLDRYAEDPNYSVQGAAIPGYSDAVVAEMVRRGLVGAGVRELHRRGVPFPTSALRGPYARQVAQWWPHSDLDRLKKEIVSLVSDPATRDEPWMIDILDAVSPQTFPLEEVLDAFPDPTERLTNIISYAASNAYSPMSGPTLEKLARIPTLVYKMPEFAGQVPPEEWPEALAAVPGLDWAIYKKWPKDRLNELIASPVPDAQAAGLIRSGDVDGAAAWAKGEQGSGPLGRMMGHYLEDVGMSDKELLKWLDPSLPFRLQERVVVEAATNPDLQDAALQLVLKNPTSRGKDRVLLNNFVDSLDSDVLDPVAEYLIERPEIVLEEAAGESFEMDQALYEAAGYDQELLASLYGLLSDHNSEIFDNLEVEGLEHVLSRDKGQGWDLIGDRLVDLVLENDFEDMTLGNLLTHRNPGVRHEAQKREEELRDRWDELKEEG